MTTHPRVHLASRTASGWSVENIALRDVPDLSNALEGTGARPGDARWVVPALSDAHRHLPHPYDRLPAKGVPDARAVELARLASAGVLSVTDMGVADIAPWPSRPSGVRTAICGIEGPSPWPRPAFGVVVNDRHAGEALVDRLVAAGADHIKIFATASGRLPKADALQGTIDLDALSAIQGRATSHGLPTAIHCHGGPMLAASLAGGASSIEHGLYLTKDDLRRMAGSGCRLVLTPLVYIRRQGEPMAIRTLELLDDAATIGVDVRIGTDGSEWTVADEVVAMVNAGADPGLLLAAVMPDSGARTASHDLVINGALVLDSDPRSDPRTLTRPMAVVERRRSIA